MLYSYCSEYMLQCTVSFTIIYTVVEINLEWNLQSISWYILNSHKVVINFDFSLHAYKLFYNLFWASSPMYCLRFIQVWKKRDWSENLRFIDILSLIIRFRYVSESQWTTAALHFLLIQFPVSVWFKSQLMRLYEFSKLICRLKWVYTLYYQYVLFVNMSCYKNSKLMSVMLSNYITCGTDYFHFEHLKLWWQIWKMWPY